MWAQNHTPQKHLPPAPAVGLALSLMGTSMCCSLRPQVELEVPQLCSFVLKTSQCTLKELHGLNLEGKALLKKTKNSEDFAAAMSR